MIILIDKDFKIIQHQFGFDVFQFVKGKRKGDGSIANPTGEEYQREDLVGYYTDLESVIKKIIYLRLAEKEDVVMLKEYLQIYKEQVNQIKELLGQSAKV